MITPFSETTLSAALSNNELKDIFNTEEFTNASRAKISTAKVKKSAQEGKAVMLD